LRHTARMTLATIVSALAIVLMAGAVLPGVQAQEPHDDPTASGTVGLFMVPRASTMQPDTFSVAAYFSAIARQEGSSSIETWAISGAYGVNERLEVFGSFEAARTGVWREALLEKDLGNGGVWSAPPINEQPFATQRWQTGMGDLRLGVKYRATGDTTSYDGISLIGAIKIPTSGDHIGTHGLDAIGRVVGSYEANEMFGLNGYIGGTWRAQPDDRDTVYPLPEDVVVDGRVQVSSSFDYGAGVEFPTRFWIKGIVEFIGVKGAMEGGDDWAILQTGLRATHETGIAFDAAFTYNVAMDDHGLPMSKGGGFAKLSYSTSRPEPLMFQGAAPMALPPVNRPPTLTIRAERTSVRQGESVRLFATVDDPDGDAVTVTWSAAAGSVSPREGEEVTWSSRGVRPGSGNISAVADDGYGGTDEASVRITVVAPPPPPEPTVVTFMCSEFRSGNTRIDNRCKAILDDAALRLRQNPQATAEIVGYSDSTGSETINTEKSLERADNAKAYFAETHGIDASRMTTRGAGPANPAADNSTREGRSQNRRIEIVVTIPPQ
jgi:outer membrane protein OmpA-like peptidoglycan-associated protein